MKSESFLFCRADFDILFSISREKTHMLKGFILYLIKRLVSKECSGMVSKLENFPKEILVSTGFLLFTWKMITGSTKSFHNKGLKPF